MKWPAVVVNLSRIRRTLQNVGLLSRVIGLLLAVTALFFALLGIGTQLKARYDTSSPVTPMKGLAAAVTSGFFADLVGMEVPHFQKEGQGTFSQRNVFSFVFRMLTDLNPQDPRTLIAREVPGFAPGKTVVLRPGQAANMSEPEDQGPPKSVIDKLGQTAQAQPPAPEPVPAAKPPATAGANVAFIYQSHSTESYLPELPNVKNPDEAYDDKVNVTLVGARLAQNLEKDGIGAVHSDKIYSTATVKDFRYPYSYKYSLKTLQEASAAHPDLKYYFDIHRDSQDRDKTTATIGGKTYAQVYFIIGAKNPNWKQNEQFANQIHEALEAKYPGLSKGIHAKTANEGNGEYNQSFSPNSILIEVGGPYNSLDECYRTTDALAEAISQVILNAQKVDSPERNAKKTS
ncbi:stage II sporulation protein P [Gordoniibacillus kamchatkensis]|uniref:Stage II sporulation protein P n=1 Tax=Gordoniibacillus kamchatkensis TaxID=1590651 RepID=A0ABR5AA82_9BACL|nr:stage II sporulation protein P [Paenibacillus sp. VKM B-2647]KIL37918.1 stage II sporulation protein P [Paenibacillus sp. VKM B-2647]